MSGLYFEHLNPLLLLPFFPLFLCVGRVISLFRVSFRFRCRAKTPQLKSHKILLKKVKMNDLMKCQILLHQLTFHRVN